MALATAGAQVLVHNGRNAAEALSVVGGINAAGGRLPIRQEGSGVVFTSSLAAHAALKRVVQPDDIAGAIAFLRRRTLVSATSSAWTAAPSSDRLGPFDRKP